MTASGPKAGQRLLRDTGPTCDALSEAVSVAVALLLDSAQADADRNQNEHTHAAKAPLPPSGSITVTPRPKREREHPRRAPKTEAWTARASLEAGAGYGLAGTGSLLGAGRVGFARWALVGRPGGQRNLAEVERLRRRQRWIPRCCLAACAPATCSGRGSRSGPALQLGVGRLRGEGSGFR